MYVSQRIHCVHFENTTCKEISLPHCTFPTAMAQLSCLDEIDTVHFADCEQVGFALTIPRIGEDPR